MKKLFNRLICLVIAIIFFVSCSNDRQSSYTVVVGKDKKIENIGNSIREEYIISIKQGNFPRSFDFSVTLGYYNSVEVGDTIQYTELLWNNR